MATCGGMRLISTISFCWMKTWTICDTILELVIWIKFGPRVDEPPNQKRAI